MGLTIDKTNKAFYIYFYNGKAVATTKIKLK